MMIPFLCGEAIPQERDTTKASALDIPRNSEHPYHISNTKKVVDVTITCRMASMRSWKLKGESLVEE